MQRFLIITLMMAGIAQGADHKYHNQPQINFVVLPHGMNNATPIGYIDALRQGSLQGTEGGISILIKSLIVTIPTACYLLWTVGHAWYAKEAHTASALKIKQLKEQTQLLITHTHYMQALADFLKARALTEAALANDTTNKKRDDQAH